MTNDLQRWDTDIGSERRDFPSTLWSDFLRTGGGSAEAAGPKLESLALRYWKPVYSYLRARWARSNEDAKDLTQGFFLWIFESGFLSKVDRERGRFRVFLKAALDNFVGGIDRGDRAVKRGGGRKLLNLDDLGGVDSDPSLPDPEAGTPEEILDEVWRREILTRGVDLLEKSLKEADKQVYFQVFQDYFLGDQPDLDYPAVAAKYSIAVTDVANYLHYSKSRFQEILRELLADTVEGPGNLQEEILWLLGSGGR